MKRLVILRAALGLWCMALIQGCLLCQEVITGFSESVEDILALTDEYDPASLLEGLSELKEYPVRINGGDEKEISRLFFLTEFQVMVLADHVRKNGSVITLYELALLPAFDRNTVMLMAPYISLESPGEAGGKGYGRTTVTLTSSARFSGEDNDTEGVRSLFKVRHERELIDFGLTAENDPGERFTFRSAPRD